MKFSLDVLSTSEADKLAGKRNTVKERNRERRTMTGKAWEMSKKKMQREEQTLTKNAMCISYKKATIYTSIPKALTYVY